MGDDPARRLLGRNLSVGNQARATPDSPDLAIVRVPWSLETVGGLQVAADL